VCNKEGRMGRIYEWIKNIVIYMILHTIIMNLLGNSSYKKYVSIISGMILVLIVITPLLEFMNLSDTLDYYIASNDFAIETSEFKNSLKNMEDRQVNEVFGEYKERLKQSAEEFFKEEGFSIKEFDITFDKDANSSTFGQVTGMKITASNEDGTEKESDLIQIKRIEIERIEPSKETENADKQPPSPLEIKLKNKLSDFYNIEPDNINISIQGG
jgi:stage III sporulation protein AF